MTTGPVFQEPIRIIMQTYGVDFGTALLIYQGMSVEDAKAETAIKARRGAEETATTDRFFAWIDRKATEGIYTPSEVTSIKAGGLSGEIWEHYTKNIQGTQWDFEPLPLGRPQPEKFGLTDIDWQVLEMLGGSPQKVQRELETWLGTGYINQYQARDIWSELSGRLAQARATLLATGYTEEEWPAEHERRLKLREQERAVERARTMAVPSLTGRPARPTPVTPFTEYAPALEEMRTGLAGPEPYKRWFESKFPRIIARFKAKVPEEERRLKTWKEYLERRKPELREEFFRMTPFQRGERPSVFAPRIQTVGF